MKKNIGKIIGAATIAASLLASGAGMALAQNVTGSSTTNTGTSAVMTATGTTSGTATTGPAVPGVPNTGAGGDATGTLLLLGVTGVIAVGGAWYLIGRRTPALQE